jgi:molybdenum cofactor cytidylyltransferase
MSAQPTLILIAEPASIRHDAGEDGALRYFGALAAMIERVRDSGLPLLLVCDDEGRRAAVKQLSAERMLSIAFRARTVADQHVEALVAGIQAQPNAGGWLALPLAMPMLKLDTLRRVADALQRYPIAYAEHRQQQGYPIGFSSELFSELIQVDCLRELERLVVRYPTHRVEVDDPGVLLAPASLQWPVPYLLPARGTRAAGAS